MEKFYLSEYLRNQEDQGPAEGTADARARQGETYGEFRKICTRIKEAFFQQWEREENLKSSMEIQKKAIIGYKNETDYFKDRVRSLIREYGAADTAFPPWYEGLTEAVYHENWGLAGVAQWFGPEYAQSSSAKIIGDRIYFLENGKMMRKPQSIEKNRREQLIRAFLLLTPEERLDREVHEIYLLDGTRVTIFCGGMAKTGQDTIIFRRYVVPNYTFEEQADRGTIPREAIPLFKAMVRIGFSVAFLGAVRTAKSTFLCTWQSCEDPSLEGVMVETDPEIPLHELMPEAPVVQLLADNEKLRNISKHLLRSDADYFVLAEARDGNALDTALRIACKGTKRMKITFHTRNPRDFPAEMAAEIVKSSGGDFAMTERKAAESFDYLFHFVQLADKSQKRLRGIFELSYDRTAGRPRTVPICTYDYEKDRWSWRDHIGEDKERYGREEAPEQFRQMQRVLWELAGGSRPEGGELGEAQGRSECGGTAVGGRRRWSAELGEDAGRRERGEGADRGGIQ